MIFITIIIIAAALILSVD